MEVYDWQRDDGLDFPDDPRQEPCLEEVKAAAYEVPFVCVVDESAGFRG